MGTYLLEILCCFILVGCSSIATIRATIYPVEGPIYDQKSVKTMKATIYGVFGRHGKIKIDKSEGPSCEGEWSTEDKTQIANSSRGLIDEYGGRYLSSSTLNSSSGHYTGRAQLKCLDGNIVDVEFLTEGFSSHGFGIAKDQQKNIFRVLF